MQLVAPAEAPARIWEQQLPEAAAADAVRRPPRQCRRRQLVVVRALPRQEEQRLLKLVPAADVDGAELALRAVVQHLRPAVLRQRQPVAAVGVEAAARQPRSNLNVPSWIRAQR